MRLSAATTIPAAVGTIAASVPWPAIRASSLPSGWGAQKMVESAVTIKILADGNGIFLIAENAE
jgi:hypothetical protein